ncbi:hypothetical protein BOX15_Mlig030275g2, partial [Macrostomum lignano]
IALPIAKMKRLLACTCWSSGRQKRGGFDVGDCDTAGSQQVFSTVTNGANLGLSCSQKTCTPPFAPSAHEATISRSRRRRYALVFCFFHQQFESTSSSAAQRAARDLLRGLGFITHSFFNLDKLDDILSELRAVASVEHSQTDCLAVMLLLHRSAPAIAQISANPAALLQPLIDCCSLNGKPKILLILQHDETENPNALLPMDHLSSAVRLNKDLFIHYGYSLETAESGDDCCGCLKLLKALANRITADPHRIDLPACLSHAAEDVQQQEDEQICTTRARVFSSLSRDLIFVD